MIKVITGTMFSGKTTRLIEMAEELRKANDLNYTVYRPFTHYVHNQSCVLSHKNIALAARPLTTLEQLEKDTSRDIFIDSFQMLPAGIIYSIEILSVQQHKNFYLFGTRTDVYGCPNATAMAALSIADEVEVLPSKCSICGGVGIYNTLMPGVDLKTDINTIVGEKYRVLCHRCFLEEQHGTPRQVS